MTMNEDGQLLDADPPAPRADGEGHGVLFHALAEPTRLALLAHLATGEHRVRDLVEHMHLAQSTVSTHLTCLRDVGLVQVRAEGRASWFRLAQPARLADLLRAADALLDAAGATPSLRAHERIDAVAGGAS